MKQKLLVQHLQVITGNRIALGVCLAVGGYFTKKIFDPLLSIHEDFVKVNQKIAALNTDIQVQNVKIDLIYDILSKGMRFDMISPTTTTTSPTPPPQSQIKDSHVSK